VFAPARPVRGRPVGGRHAKADRSLDRDRLGALVVGDGNWWSPRLRREPCSHRCVERRCSDSTTASSGSAANARAGAEYRAAFVVRGSAHAIHAKQSASAHGQRSLPARSSRSALWARRRHAATSSRRQAATPRPSSVRHHGATGLPCHAQRETFLSQTDRSGSPSSDAV